MENEATRPPFDTLSAPTVEEGYADHPAILRIEETLAEFGAHRASVASGDYLISLRSQQAAGKEIDHGLLAALATRHQQLLGAAAPMRRAA